MLINQSGTTFYLDRDGVATEDVSAGVSLLLAPGGSIDESVAKRHGIDGRLTPHGDADLTNPVTGEPIVLVDGRAYAKKLFEGADDARKAPRAQSKAVRPSEDKAVEGPAPVAAHAPAGKPAGLATPPKDRDDRK